MTFSRAGLAFLALGWLYAEPNIKNMEKGLRIKLDIKDFNMKF